MMVNTEQRNEEFDFQTGNETRHFDNFKMPDLPGLTHGTSTPSSASLHGSSRSTSPAESDFAGDHNRYDDNVIINFRPLQNSDRDQIQDLHEEWFPVKYKDEFYNELVKNRLFNSGEKLFSCVGIHQKRHIQTDAVNHEMDSNDDQQILCSEIMSNLQVSDQIIYDQIVSCVVGTFVKPSRCKETSNLLIPNQERYKRMFYIMTLGTVTEYRHLGLGTTMVQTCMRLVEKDPQCGALYLHVIVFNSGAIRFYENLGFHRVKEIKDYYTIDGKLYNCYLYAKYYHGNRGHWSFLDLSSQMIMSFWKKLTAQNSWIADSDKDLR